MFPEKGIPSKSNLSLNKPVTKRLAFLTLLFKPLVFANNKR